MKHILFAALAILTAVVLAGCTCNPTTQAPIPAAESTAQAQPSATTEIPAATEAAKEASYVKLTPEEAKARMDSGEPIIILDVRTQEEFDEGHIPGAVLLPNENIGEAMPSELPDKNAEILVYCRSGNRSAQAAKKLLALGYTQVFDFGGIKDWPYETTKD